MKIGVLREVKNREYRVALTPDGAEALVGAGHLVKVERGAGMGSGYPDADYEEAGARIVDAATAWDSDLVLKVKEPVEQEYAYLQGQILFTYLHLAGVDLTLTDALLESRTTAIGYETVEDEGGRLPLLAPMSAVAGSMTAGIGQHYLAQGSGGKGMLLGRVLEQSYGRVVVVGDGVVGRHAARAALGLGAEVVLFSRHAERREALERAVGSGLRFRVSDPETLARETAAADLVVGAVLHRGGRAPRVITEAMVKGMECGSVIVDVSIDQGGCVETSRPTTHADPVFERHGVTHYCVTNMPGAYPRTATRALTTATLPYVLALAGRGMAAVKSDPGFARGVNIHPGHLCCRAVAEGLDRMGRYRALEELI